MWTRSDLAEAVPDFIALSLGHPVEDAHPAARQLAADGVSFAQVLQRARGLANAADLERALTTGDIIPSTITAITERIAQAPSGVTEHRTCCRKVNLPNYKSATFGEVSVSDDIPAAPDGGDPAPVAIVNGTDGWVTGRASRFTIGLHLARTLFVNGDLDTMAMLLDSARQALLRREGRLFADYLESNPTIGDGAALFTGANSITASLDVSGLDSAMNKLRTQPTEAGAKSGARGRILLVPADKELTAILLLSTLGPDRGGFRLAVSPWLASGTYYVLANPAENASLLRLTLGGVEAPQYGTKSAIGFDAVGVHVEHSVGFTAVSRLGICKVTA